MFDPVGRRAVRVLECLHLRVRDMEHPVDAYITRSSYGAPGPGGLVVVGEDGLDGLLEEARKFEGEGKAGVVSAGFDGVDGLTRDFELLGEIGLRPVAFSAENAKAVIQRATGADGR